MLLSRSFISLCDLIDQAGLLPAGINSGEIWGRERKHLGNRREPVPLESTAVPQPHTRAHLTALGACATPDSGPKSLGQGAFG